MSSAWIIRALALALLVAMGLGIAAMRHLGRTPNRGAGGTELVRKQPSRAVPSTGGRS